MLTYLLTITSFSQEEGKHIFLNPENTEGTNAICDMVFADIPDDFSDTEPYVFNVFFHKITDDNGDTPDIYDYRGWNISDGIGDGDLIVEETYLEAIRALNINYNKFNIFFKYRGFDLIKSTQYLNINNINEYENLIDFSKTYTNDNGDISYKDNAFNFFIIHTFSNDPLYTWSFPRQLESEFLYAYNVFQPMGIGPIASPTPLPYDKINAIVSFDMGYQLGLLRTARNSTNSMNNYLWSEHVTRDVTDIIKPYNANKAGDRVSDTRANTWAIENDPLDTSSNTRRYRIFGNTCSCNNENVSLFNIRDLSTYIDNGDGTITPTGDLYLDAPVFNIMSRFMYDRWDTSACNTKRRLTNGQGARLRCLIDYRFGLWDDFMAEDGLASLYEPYSGSYYFAGPPNSNIPKFQYGFDYKFVDCNINSSGQVQVFNVPTEYGDTSFSYTNTVMSEYDKYWEPNHGINEITHPNHTAILIEQIDPNQPQKCYNNINRSAIGGSVTKFNDNVLNTNVTITPQDSLNINNTNLIQNLQQGLYKIEKSYEDGSTQEQIILKQNN